MVDLRGAERAHRHVGPAIGNAGPAIGDPDERARADRHQYSGTYKHTRAHRYGGSPAPAAACHANRDPDGRAGADQCARGSAAIGDPGAGYPDGDDGACYSDSHIDTRAPQRHAASTDRDAHADEVDGRDDSCNRDAPIVNSDDNAHAHAAFDTREERARASCPAASVGEPQGSQRREWACPGR